LFQNLKEKYLLGDEGLNGAVTKWALNEHVGIVWNALTWLSIRDGGGLF
jgi:hypothetical protein